MRLLSAILPAAVFGCLLTAPVAFAADGEGTKLNLGSADESAKAAASNSASTGGSLIRGRRRRAPSGLQ